MDTSHWYITRIVFILAGVVNLLALIAVFLTGSIWWLAINALVALMQIIFALTGWCPSAMLLKALGVPEK